MTIDIREDVAAVVETGGDTAPSSHYVDWAAIVAGAVVAWAIAFLFGTFGAGIGLSLTGSPWKEGMSVGWFMVAGGIWFIWTQVSSVMAGGYVAGRLRRRIGDATAHEGEIRDGMHGLLVWGVAALVGALLALGLGAAAGRALSTAAAETGLLEEREVGIIVGHLFRPAIGNLPSSTALGDGSGTAPAATGTAGASGEAPESSAPSGPGRDEVSRILASVEASGVLPQEERVYIAQLVAAQTGVAPEEAAKRVQDYVIAGLEEAREAAEVARKTGIVIAFMTAATFLVSALAGWWAAVLGGNHRDENIELKRWFRLR